MEKTKTYKNVRFDATVIQEAIAAWDVIVSSKAAYSWGRSITIGDEDWEFDTDEEFFAAYGGKFYSATIRKSASQSSLYVIAHRSSTTITVKLADRLKIERVFDIFEKKVNSSLLPIPASAEPKGPTIFIGHGRSKQWRDLKDHLTDKHGYRVNAYEVGARAGHTIRDILQDLLIGSSFALLVLTAEDETSDGEMRARQNVVHELGLFQGKLGFPRAIAIVEEGVELMSNLDGIQQLRFGKNNIAEVYGDVIATIRREFGDLRLQNSYCFRQVA